MAPASPIKIGDPVPDFKAEVDRKPIGFHEWLGDSWGILLSIPALAVAVRLEAAASFGRDFARRGARILGLAIEPADSGAGFPIAADPENRIAAGCGMNPGAEAPAAHTVFLIDPKKKLRLILDYPASAGVDFGEVLWALDRLQLSDVAPASYWRAGDDASMKVVQVLGQNLSLPA